MSTYRCPAGHPSIRPDLPCRECVYGALALLNRDSSQHPFDNSYAAPYQAQQQGISQPYGAPLPGPPPFSNQQFGAPQQGQSQFASFYHAAPQQAHLPFGQQAVPPSASYYGLSGATSGAQNTTSIQSGWWPSHTQPQQPSQGYGLPQGASSGAPPAPLPAPAASQPQQLLNPFVPQAPSSEAPYHLQAQHAGGNASMVSAQSTSNTTDYSAGMQVMANQLAAVQSQLDAALAREAAAQAKEAHPREAPSQNQQGRSHERSAHLDARTTLYGYNTSRQAFAVSEPGSTSYGASRPPRERSPGPVAPQGQKPASNHISTRPGKQEPTNDEPTGSADDKTSTQAQADDEAAQSSKKSEKKVRTRLLVFHPILSNLADPDISDLKVEPDPVNKLNKSGTYTSEQRCSPVVFPISNTEATVHLKLFYEYWGPSNATSEIESVISRFLESQEAKLLRALDLVTGPLSDEHHVHAGGNLKNHRKAVKALFKKFLAAFLYWFRFYTVIAERYANEVRSSYDVFKDLRIELNLAHEIYLAMVDKALSEVPDSLVNTIKHFLDDTEYGFASKATAALKILEGSCMPGLTEIETTLKRMAMPESLRRFLEMPEKLKADPDFPREILSDVEEDSIAEESGA